MAWKMKGTETEGMMVDAFNDAEEPDSCSSSSWVPHVAAAQVAVAAADNRLECICQEEQLFSNCIIEQPPIQPLPSLVPGTGVVAHMSGRRRIIPSDACFPTHSQSPKTMMMLTLIMMMPTMMIPIPNDNDDYVDDLLVQGLRQPVL